MFVPDEVWITANYKETQLVDMRPGQSVEIRIDAYPGKVVQRVPVKIVVDNWPSDIPVGPGMSVVPWTRVR